MDEATLSNRRVLALMGSHIEWPLSGEVTAETEAVVMWNGGDEVIPVEVTVRQIGPAIDWP